MWWWYISNNVTNIKKGYGQRFICSTWISDGDKGKKADRMKDVRVCVVKRRGEMKE